MKHYLLSTGLVLVCTLTALTQPDYQTHLKSVVLPAGAFLPARDYGEQPHEEARSDVYNVLLLRFETLPTNYEQQAAIAAAGILLEAYIPDYTYLARVPQGINLEALNVEYYLPYLPEYKLSAALTYAPAAESESGMITLMAYPYRFESPAILQQSLIAEGYPDVELAGHGVRIQVSLFGINALSEHPLIMYLETAPSTPIPESVPGRAQHRANLLSTIPGFGFDGAGVSIAIADDGPVSHEDFRGRITQHTNANIGNHGDMVAGIACGAGNIDPQAMGAAPGADLHLYPIEGYPHVEQAPENFINHGTVITITSYSESPAGEYSYSAYSLDGQAIEHPQLIHVFSAGNNAADVVHPLYGNIFDTDGASHGNITGGRKASKSAIAVGNVYDNDNIRFSSSRGPAGDGRIKPDICSFGQGHLSTNVNNSYQFGGGTSAAAPGVGGGLAALEQLYRSLHNGNIPDGGLLKAALLNSAEDLGRVGPDYTYGWGRMHLGRAAAILQNFHHFTGVVAHGGQQNHVITVPPNTKQIRVMTYWSDMPGAPMAGKALVNDLDSRLIGPGNQTTLPWALSAFPHQDSLLKPAWRGTDRLNNMEQVVLENPAAGNYTLRVNGYLVPQGPQQYYIVYSFITKDLELTYPIGGEGFLPGETQIIRWDATNIGQTGTFSMSYSTDSMATWTTATTSIPSNARQYSWTVPNVVSGKVYVRVTRGNQSSVSPAAFTIIGQPDFQIFYNSTNSATVSWSPVPGATSYVVHALGEKYMAQIGVTNTTSFNVPIAPWESKWYSVSANNNQGAVGRRAYAKKYLHTPCDAWVTLSLQFDLYPGETRWEIVNNSGVVVASGGPYTNQAPNSTLNLQQCLASGCYELVVYDSYGDGMCCNRGNGFYQITSATGGVLVNGAQFTFAKVTPFCVSAAVTPLSVQLAELQPVRCKGGTDGWISVQAAGGTGNYTYSWNTGTSGATISNLSSGTYTVVVSDGVSEVQLSVVISEPSVPFLVSLSSTATNCSTNEPNGAITGTLSGGAPPYTYLWSNGATTPALTGLSAGVYAVTVTDGNGCHAIGSATVLQSTPLHLELFPEEVSCHSGNDGAIFTTVSGGALPYSYAWSTGSAMGWVNNLAAGAYSLTVTDANGCSVQQSAGVAQPQPLVPVALATPATNGANGSIFLEVNGGTAPYSYMWSNGATTQNLNGLSPGTYTVIVTDSHGCIGATSASVILGETPGLSYCIARGSNTNFEWIYSVQIGDYLNISGNNGGYGNFTASVPIPLSIGTTYPLLLTPQFQNNPFNESWRIWLDLNHDGDFLDAGELLFQPGLTNQPVSGSIQIPAGATPGVTRMRIAMKYGSPANACGVFAYGEVEDYTVFISNNGGNLALAPGNALTEQAHALQHGPSSDVDAENFTPAFRQESSNPDFSLFPNPAATGYVICRYVSIDNGNGKISIFDAEGRVVKNQNLNIESGENRWELVLDGLSSGIYYVQIDNGSHPMRQTLMVIGH